MPTAHAVLDDQSTGRSAMRKATWRLIPMIALGYGVAYMDRVNISFAQLQMNQKLHFSATIYGIGAGLFFVSYAACEIPSNLLLYRFGARRWLARIMVTWGLLAMGMMFVRTANQFYIMRFLLGMAEAGFFPGVLFYLTQWFPAHIRARTISRFYVSLPLSSVVMGGLAGTLFHMDGLLHLAGWQWLFLVEGLPPVLLSVIFLKFLPDSPKTAKWLTEGERSWIEAQLAAEGADTPGGHLPDPHATSVAGALAEPRVWLFGIVNMLMLGTSYAYGFLRADSDPETDRAECHPGRPDHRRIWPARRRRHAAQRLALRSQSRGSPAHSCPLFARISVFCPCRSHRQSVVCPARLCAHVLLP